MARFESAVMLITGAGGGIGSVTAQRAADAGALVVMAGRNEAALTAVANQIRSRGGEAHIVVQDLLQPGAATRMVRAAVERYGKLDVLVNNAAIHSGTPFLELTEEEWDRVLATNLRAPFLCSQAAVAAMGKNGGAIVNVGSVVGVVGAPRRAAYGASKGGLVQLTRCLAAELATSGIRVNAVAPSIIRTQMTEVLLSDRDFAARVSERTPLGRAGQPEEVANAILYLASGEARYITGHILMVDGGWSAV